MRKRNLIRESRKSGNTRVFLFVVIALVGGACCWTILREVGSNTTSMASGESGLEPGELEVELPSLTGGPSLPSLTPPTPSGELFSLAPPALPKQPQPSEQLPNLPQLAESTPTAPTLPSLPTLGKEATAKATTNEKPWLDLPSLPSGKLAQAASTPKELNAEPQAIKPVGLTAKPTQATNPNQGSAIVFRESTLPPAVNNTMTVSKSAPNTSQLESRSNQPAIEVRFPGSSPADSATASSSNLSNTSLPNSATLPSLEQPTLELASESTSTEKNDITSGTFAATIAEIAKEEETTEPASNSLQGHNGSVVFKNVQPQRIVLGQPQQLEPAPVAATETIAPLTTPSLPALEAPKVLVQELEKTQEKVKSLVVKMRPMAEEIAALAADEPTTVAEEPAPMMAEAPAPQEVPSFVSNEMTSKPTIVQPVANKRMSISTNPPSAVQMQFHPKTAQEPSVATATPVDSPLVDVNSVTEDTASQEKTVASLTDDRTVQEDYTVSRSKPARSLPNRPVAISAKVAEPLSDMNSWDEIGNSNRGNTVRDNDTNSEEDTFTERRSIGSKSPTARYASLKDGPASINVNVAHRSGQTIAVQGRIERVQIEDERVCEAIQVSESTLSLIGTKIGKTTANVWLLDAAEGQENPVRVDVEVHQYWQPDAPRDLSKNVAELEKSISRLHPKSKVQIKLSQDGSITVHGAASDEESAKQILTLVRKVCLVPVRDQLVVRTR